MGIRNPTEEHFERGLWGYDGTQWRKLRMLWGYSDRYAEEKTTAAPSDASHNLGTTAVPAGEVWVVESLVAYFVGGTVAAIWGGPNDGSTTARFFYSATVVQNTVYSLLGPYVLKEGDSIIARFVSCVGVTGIYLTVWGYKMAIG